MYQTLLTAMSHLNNACAILLGRKQVIRVSTTIWHKTQCVSVRQGRQIFVGYVFAGRILCPSCRPLSCVETPEEYW